MVSFEELKDGLPSVFQKGIDMSGYTLSTLILAKLYRDDNTTTGDVTAWDIDFHYEIDTPGSRQEFIK